MPAVAALAPAGAQSSGYPASSVPDLVRAIRAIYAALAVKERVPAPTIRFGRRYIEQIEAPPRIVIVQRAGGLDSAINVGSEQIARIDVGLDVYLWGPEPEATTDEDANELARWDAADPLLKRFVNVINRVGVGRLVLESVDPDAGKGAGAASVNAYGETYLLRFRFMREIERDGAVFSVSLPAAGTVPASPPPIRAQAPGILDTLEGDTVAQE